jgi:hypothetical protein
MRVRLPGALVCAALCAALVVGCNAEVQSQEEATSTTDALSKSGLPEDTVTPVTAAPTKARTQSVTPAVAPRRATAAEVKMLEAAAKGGAKPLIVGEKF